MTYKQNIYELTKDTLGKIAEIDGKISALQRESDNYSKEYFKIRMEDLNNQKETLILTSTAQAKRLCEDVKKTIHANFTPKAEHITDDAKLLRSGLKLTASELEEMVDRYKDNHTMSRLVWDYAADNDIMLNRDRVTEADKCEAAETLVNYHTSAISRPMFADQWLDGGYFDSICTNVTE